MHDADDPALPEFEDAIAPDSSNAAVRLIWLSRELDRDTATLAGNIDTQQLRVWRLHPYLAGFEDEWTPEPEAWAQALAELKPWTDAWVEASRLDRFEPYFRSEPPVAGRPYPEGDPRSGFLSGLRQSVRVLRDDATRLWIAGDRDRALDRIEAVARVCVWLGEEDASLMHGLVAASMLEYVFEWIDTAIDSDPSDVETQRLLAVVRIVSEPDIAGLRSGWMRSYAYSSAWILEALDTEHGTARLWMTLGQMARMRAMFEQFEPLLDELAGEEVDDDTPRVQIDEDGTARFDLPAAFRAVSDQLGGITIDDLREGYSRAVEHGDVIQRAWHEDQSNDAFERAAAELEDDPTYMGDLLGVTTAARVHKTATELRTQIERALTRLEYHGNAAARYRWLGSQLRGRLRQLGEEHGFEADGGIDHARLDVWRLDPELADTQPWPDAEAWAGVLIELDPLFDAWVEASRLDTFQGLWGLERPTGVGADTRVGGLADDDAYLFATLPACRRAARLLRDDAHRLWIEGDHEASLERIEAIVRTGRHLAQPELWNVSGLTGHALISMTLGTLELMAEVDNGAHADRVRLIVGLVPDNDPAGVAEQARRESMWQIDAALAGIERNDAETWALLAEMKLRQDRSRVRDDTLRNVFDDVGPTGHADLDRVLAGEDAAAVGEAAVIAQARKVLGDPSIEELRQRLLEARGLADDLGRRWHAGAETEELERQAMSFDNEDTLGVSLLAGLNQVSQMIASDRRLVQRRRDALRRLEAVPQP